MADCYLIKQGGGGSGSRPQGGPTIWPLDAYGYPVGDVTIDNGITHLRRYIFSDNKSYNGINSINFPETLGTIQEYCFNNTNFIKPINLNQVNYIGQYGFYNSSIPSISFDLNSPKNSYTFGQHSFYSCTNLKEYIDMPYNCSNIYLYDWAFRDTGFLGFNFLNKLNNLYIHGNYTFAGQQVTDDFVNQFSNNINYVQSDASTTDIFSQCHNLNNIYIRILSRYMFGDCHSLQQVTIADNPYRLGTTGQCLDAMFQNCYNLKSVDFLNKDSLKGYGNGCVYCFQNCQNLEYVNNFPSTISSIQDYSFQECRNLKDIYFQNNDISYIGISAFYNCRNINIYFKNFSSSSIYLNAYCFSYCHLTENCLNSLFNGLRNCANTTLQYSLFAYSFGYEEAFPSDLWDNTFLNVYSLKNVTVYDYNSYPQTHPVGMNCLSNCINLFKVDFLNSHQQSICNDNSYQNCYKLEKFYVNGNALSVANTLMNININCFRNCYNLKYFDLSRAVSTYTSGGVMRNAFENCFSLTQLALPSCIRTINTYAFLNCYSLKDVFLNSTVQLTGTFGAPQAFNIYNRSNCSTITYNMDLKQNNITVKINNEQRDLNELPYIIKYDLNNAEDKTTERVLECAAYSPNHLPAYTNISIPSIGTHEFANFDFSSTETNGYRVTFEMVNNIYPDKIYIGYEEIEFEDIYTMIVPQNAKVKYRLIKANYKDLIGEIDITEDNMIIPLSMQENTIFNYSFGVNSSLTLDEQINLFENDELIKSFRENNWTITSDTESSLAGEIKCNQELPLKGATYATLKIKFPNTFGERFTYGAIQMILKHYGSNYDYSFVYISERQFALPSYNQVQSGQTLSAGDYYLWRESNPSKSSYQITKDVTLKGDTLYITFGYIRGSNQHPSYPIHQMGIQKLSFYALKDE